MQKTYNEVGSWRGLKDVLSVFFLSVGALALTAAEPIVVGTGETHTFSNETAFVQDAAVTLADRVLLEKTKGGTLTLETGRFTENQPVNVKVREGVIKVVKTEQQLAAYPDDLPAALKEDSGLALWFDTANAASLVFKAGSDTEVCEMHDVRETGDGSAERPYLYTRAVTNFQCSTSYPQRKEVSGKIGLSLGTYGGGVWMNWVKPDGTQQKVTGMRNVFVVWTAVNANERSGSFLGQRVGVSPCFQTGGGTLWAANNNEQLEIHAARTYLDGIEFDGFSQGITAGTGAHVIDVEALDAGLFASCFANDRDMQLTWPDGTQHTNELGKALNPFFNTTAQTGGGNRVGGGTIYEVIVFTRQLAPAERLAVSDYLNAKWRGAVPPQSVTVTVETATNTAVEVADGLGGFTVKGDAAIVKSGDSAASIRSSFTVRGSSSSYLEMTGGTLRLGYAIPFKVAAGDTINVNRMYYGPEIAPNTAGGDATKLVKAGTGPATIDAIPDGVKTLQVTGGELTLAAPEKAAAIVSAPVETDAVDPAASGTTFSFEGIVPDGQTNVGYADGNTFFGWHAIVPPQTSGKPDSSVRVYSCKSGQDLANDWNITRAATDGYASLVIKNNASAWTTIRIPERGQYKFTVQVAGRSGETGLPRNLMIGPDNDHLIKFGEIIRTDGAQVFHEFTAITPLLEAGDYNFWIKHPDGGEWYDKDRTYQFDSMSFVKIGDRKDFVYSIPNGDFEMHTLGWFNTGWTLDNTNKVLFFTVTQPASVGTATGDEALGAIHGRNGFSFRTARNAHFKMPWTSADDLTQFMLTGSGEGLRTTFTPPAGTWRFAADFSFLKLTAHGTSSYSADAKVIIGEEEITLGNVQVGDQKLVRRTWPREFTVDGETPVTLVLSGKLVQVFCGHGILDNLVLVPARNAPVNLLVDGGFENGTTSWSTTTTPKPLNVTGISVLDYADTLYTTYFGQEAFQGLKCVRIVNDDALYQSVTFPTGGVYRLSVNAQGRWSNPSAPAFGNGRNPLAAYVTVRGSGVTNWLGATDTAVMTNFHEYAFQVRVPEAGGTYDVGFRGLSVWPGGDAPAVDRTIVIDAVQLYKVETDGVFEMPEDLVINAAAGTQLKLDFDGTNKVRSISVNGRKYSGVVSLETRPELLGVLSGRGALLAHPAGTMLLFR
ncbi:MAG: hypothetical protein GX565_00085 [Lentisphaerae bacterium]|nr:hypothetical protein [Lentisphaerota bacterium]